MKDNWHPSPRTSFANVRGRYFAAVALVAVDTRTATSLRSTSTRSVQTTGRRSPSLHPRSCTVAVGGVVPAREWDREIGSAERCTSSPQSHPSQLTIVGLLGSWDTTSMDTPHSAKPGPRYLATPYEDSRSATRGE